MVDEHQALVAKLEGYLQNLEAIAAEARDKMDFDAAREAIIAAVKLTTSILSVKTWFTEQESKNSIAERIIDKSMS